MKSEVKLRELTVEELEQVSGGFAPIIAAFGSFLTHHAVRSVGQYYLSRGLTGYAIYAAAEQYRD